MILTNQVFGWGGLLFFFYLEKKTNKKKYYIIGILIYLFSWFMLALGIVLAGPESVEKARNFIINSIHIKNLKYIITLLIVFSLALTYYYKKIKKKSGN